MQWLGDCFGRRGSAVWPCCTGCTCRAKVIYQQALERLPKGESDLLYEKYVTFQKQFGDKWVAYTAARRVAFRLLFSLPSYTPPAEHSASVTSCVCRGVSGPAPFIRRAVVSKPSSGQTVRVHTPQNTRASGAHGLFLHLYGEKCFPERLLMRKKPSVCLLAPCCVFGGCAVLGV